LHSTINSQTQTQTLVPVSFLMSSLSLFLLWAQTTTLAVRFGLQQIGEYLDPQDPIEEIVVVEGECEV
jgi:hypothetical protein